MRGILLERYGVDIDEAVCRFSTQNYAFIFSEKPYMIRVSISPKKSRKEILSELMWVDDLKPFKQTICRLMGFFWKNLRLTASYTVPVCSVRHEGTLSPQPR